MLNSILVFLYESQLIDTVEQAISGKTVNWIMGDVAIWQRYSRRLHVDVDVSARMIDKPFVSRRVDNDWQQPVLQRIASENIGDL